MAEAMMVNLLDYQDAETQQRILLEATGVDYQTFEYSGVGFDYDALMRSPQVEWADIVSTQKNFKVGETPLFELSGVTQLVRHMSRPGHGAQILLKDEAANASGSFKARRASLAVALAKRRGYAGVVAATSGNYGAAVASQAAMQGLKCIILQEAYDSRGVGQPEILEKARACEAYGAEVVQLSVGPELFLTLLKVLDETGYFSASLYAPYSVLGVETLGFEIATQCREAYGRAPDSVVVSHAGGGNVTGTARGLLRAGAVETDVIAASVNLAGLHMASDGQFNRKSFTTSHTGFAMPFLDQPDRVDVPRNACRPLRYLDRMVTVEQGDVFYATELLAQFDGLERGPAGNTALAAAIPIARELPDTALVVVQESEYSGAGKNPYAQLAFARDNGIEVSVGDPRKSSPGANIILPANPEGMTVTDVDLRATREKYVRRRSLHFDRSEADLVFLAEETRLPVNAVEEIVWSK